MTPSNELIDYISGLISLNTWRDVHTVSLRGMSIPVPTNINYIGRLKVPIHLSSLLAELNTWYFDETPVDFFVERNIGKVLLKGVYPNEIRSKLYSPNCNTAKIKFHIDNIEFIENKKPSWEDWFIIEENEYAT